MDLRQALQLFVYAVVAVAIFALCWWAVDYAAPPHPFGHVLHVVLVVLAVLVLIGLLLKLAGYPIGPPGPPSPPLS